MGTRMTLWSRRLTAVGYVGSMASMVQPLGAGEWAGGMEASNRGRKGEGTNEEVSKDSM